MIGSALESDNSIDCQWAFVKELNKIRESIRKDPPEDVGEVEWFLKAVEPALKKTKISEMFAELRSSLSKLIEQEGE